MNDDGACTTPYGTYQNPRRCYTYPAYPAEVVPGLVEVEVAVPRLIPAVW